MHILVPIIELFFGLLYFEIGIYIKFLAYSPVHKNRTKSPICDGDGNLNRED